jgi:DNA-binding transcriptional MerR regulator
MNTVNEAKKAMTIGRLIKELKKAYPDISSSKLRFLESQDLVKPKRGLNKYRIYTVDDVKKINFILKMQKEFYLPLDVIKQKLQSKEYEDYLKEGKELKNLQLDLGGDADIKKEASFIAFDRIKKKLKVTQDFLEDLIDHDLVEYKNDNGKILINGADMDIIKMSRELSRFGIQGKHLKMFENFAIRHSSFIQQIIMPLMISSKKELHKKGKRVALKLERELCELHEMLLKKENRKFLEKNK